MAVAFDASSESTTGTSGTVGSYSWSHTPVGTPKGIVVFAFYDVAATGRVTGITYGGVAMSAVSGGTAVDTVGEPGNCQVWFLGSGIPTGTQTVSVTVTGLQNNYAVAISLTADTNTETTGVVLLQENQTLAEQSVNDGSIGTNSIRLAGLHSGLPAVPSPGANSTAVHDIVYAAGFIQAVVRETTPGQGSRSVGFTSATGDDVAAVHLAIREILTGLTITSVNTTNTAFSAQTNSAVIGTGLSASVVCTYAGIACTNESASSSTSLKITFPNFFTNNIKLGRNYEFKVVG